MKNIFSTLSNTDRLKEQWKQYETETKQNDASQEILEQIHEAEKRKDNIVSAIAAGVLDFGDAKAQIDTIKTELSDLNAQLDKQEKTSKEPDWEKLFIDKKAFESLPFSGQRKAIEKIILSITLYNTYAVIKHPFPRTDSGSYDARINIARGERYKLKRNNRTRQ